MLRRSGSPPARRVEVEVEVGVRGYLFENYLNPLAPINT